MRKPRKKPLTLKGDGVTITIGRAGKGTKIIRGPVTIQGDQHNTFYSNTPKTERGGETGGETIVGQVVLRQTVHGRRIIT
jgi:hypothetical protein